MPAARVARSLQRTDHSDPHPLATFVPRPTTVVRFALSFAPV